MAETGFARGSLSPIYYFENAAGHLVMPVYDAGKPEQARLVFNARFKPKGYDWRETKNLAEVDRLESRLIAQEARKTELMIDQEAGKMERIQSMVRSNLRHRMVSSDCSEFEREFIRLYMSLRADKKSKYEQRLKEHNSYLWIRNMNSGTKLDDKMPLQDGEFWRNGG